MTRQRRAALKDGSQDGDSASAKGGLNRMREHRPPVQRKPRTTNSNGAIAQQEKKFARRASELAQMQMKLEGGDMANAIDEEGAAHKELRRSGRITTPGKNAAEQDPDMDMDIDMDMAMGGEEGTAVMMFGRRSSPARAVPLDRFRGGKGKIACTWVPPAGHRPCHRSFTRRADLERHIATVHQMLNVACAQCGATFSRQDALTRHQRDSCSALFQH